MLQRAEHMWESRHFALNYSEVELSPPRKLNPERIWSGFFNKSSKLLEGWAKSWIICFMFSRDNPEQIKKSLEKMSDNSIFWISVSTQSWLSKRFQTFQIETKNFSQNPFRRKNPDEDQRHNWDLSLNTFRIYWGYLDGWGDIDVHLHSAVIDNVFVIIKDIISDQINNFVRNFFLYEWALIYLRNLR